MPLLDSIEDAQAQVRGEGYAYMEEDRDIATGAAADSVLDGLTMRAATEHVPDV